MNIGIIGTGGRSLAYLGILKNQSEHKVTAICDIDDERRDSFRRIHLPDLLAEKSTKDYQILLSDPAIDLVLICTPDTSHREIALAAAAAGKAMLLEKPVATTLDDSLALLEGLKNYSRPIYLGFVLRYSPFYIKLNEIIKSGKLGEIVTINAREMLDARHASSFYRRWHRFRINNGGLMNAKCSHDLDILNWIVGSDPIDVCAFGGTRFFVPRTDASEHCRDCYIKSTCPYSYNIEYYKENFGTFHSLSDLCVYNSEKDIVDHECMLIHYLNGVVVQFELCMFGHEENRTMTIHGTQAVLEADFLRNTLTVKPIKGDPEIFTLEGQGGGHGGGDEILMSDLIGDIASNRHVNHIRAGCLATLVALAGEESMSTGKIVNIARLEADHSNRLNVTDPLSLKDRL
ncbi:MAG: Gfo/Idh/MocA family protein [Saccharofermentanales bacterium]